MKKPILGLIRRLAVIIIILLALEVYARRTYSDSDTTNTPTTTTATKKKKITCSSHERGCIDPVGVIGKWVHADYDRWVENGTNPDLHKRSFDAPNPGGWKCPDFYDEFVWQSPDLSDKFDPVETCRLLGNSTVALVGDSTMQQFHATLTDALRPGKCHAQVKTELSDTLVGRAYGNMNRGKTWRVVLAELNPDIMIVTVGAHVRVGDDHFEAIIDEVLSGMQDGNKATKFAWKTQAPGGCTKSISFPNNTTLAAMSVNYTVASYGRDTYNWYQFYNRDLLLLSKLQEMNMPYMDVRMLYSRSDAHISSQTGRPLMKGVIDCLHMCMPGPLDVAGRLFHRLLMDIDKGAG